MQEVVTMDLFLRNYKRYLTHYSPVLLFYTPWKHQKTWEFSVSREYKKATPGCNGLNWKCLYLSIKSEEKDLLWPGCLFIIFFGLELPFDKMLPWPWLDIFAVLFLAGASSSDEIGDNGISTAVVNSFERPIKTNFTDIPDQCYVLLAYKAKTDIVFLHFLTNIFQSL